MPRVQPSSNRSTSRRHWIATLFSFENLVSNESIEAALEEFQNAIQNSNLQDMVDAVLALQSGQVLALLISHVKGSCILLPWLLHEFPTTFQSLPDTRHYAILAHLAEFVSSFEDTGVSAHRAFVINIPSLINYLYGTQAGTPGGNDFELLRSMGIHLPVAAHERDGICDALRRHAQAVLRLCVYSLRSEETSQQVLDSFSKRSSHDGPEASPYTPSGGIDHPQLSRNVMDAEGFGIWKLLILSRAEQDLRTLFKKDPRSFEVVVEKLKDLSHGFFSEAERRTIYEVQINVPVYQARILHFYLLFQVDCTTDDIQKAKIQALRVYGLYNHNELSRRGFWRAIAYHIARRGKVYERRCSMRQEIQSREEGVPQYVPISFAIEEPPVHGSKSENEFILPPDDAEQLEFLKTFTKTYACSQAFLTALRDDLPISLFLQLSLQERIVVEHPYTCYVIGRSGTGKTLTMLYKMLSIERASHDFGPESRSPRQVFVTKSRLLASKVAQEYGRSTSAFGLEDCWLENRGEDDLSQMIDHNDDSYNRFSSTAALGFDKLGEKDFPLFISFDSLCNLLLEAAKGTTEYKALKKRPLITATRFVHYYWPRVNASVRSTFDPITVFNEVLGVIEGSGILHGHGTGTMAQDNYEQLSARGYPTFAGHRTEVYGIFKAYKALKRQQFEFDAADRARFLLNWIQKFGLCGAKIDYLYVDEVQDNLLLDALLLRTICANPDGMFWAGDTAQCISPGSSFRFQDLKRLLYEVELQRDTVPGSKGQHPSTLFQLAVNYRSHNGIDSCGTAIVKFIAHHWPNSLDLVPSESSGPGPKPLFLCGWKTSIANFHACLFYDAHGNAFKFGPEQCILVRNDQTKESIKKLFAGKPPAILTIYECKGIEFNDVLLYNFFEDSSATLSQWRLLLQGIGPAPNFDPAKHAIICSEMKNLYVAMTRARHTVCIADYSPNAEPMQVFFSGRNLIKVDIPCPEVIAMKPHHLQKSDYQHLEREQCERKGQELFDQNLYEEAQQYFNRAGNGPKARIAHAYHLKSAADRVMGGQQRQELYKTAGGAFKDLAKEGIGQSKEYWCMAAVCFVEARSTKRAVVAFCQAELYSSAARHYADERMFDQAVDFVKRYRAKIDKRIAREIEDEAADAYFRNQNFEKALTCFLRDSDAVDFLDRRNQIETKVNHFLFLKQFSEAGDVRKKQNRSRDALILWMQGHKEHPNCARKAAAEVVSSLWRVFRFGSNPALGSARLQELLQWADELKQLPVNPFVDGHEIQLLLKLSTGKYSESELLEDAQRLYGIGNKAAFLLSMFHFCRNISRWPANIQGQQLIQRLILFLRYTTTLTTLADMPSLDVVEKLFGVMLESNGSIQLARASFLAEFGQFENKHVFSKDDFRRRLRRVLSDYTADLISKQDQWCRRAAFLQVTGCIYIISENLTSSSCALPGHRHIAAQKPQWEAYAYQLRIINVMLEQLGLTESYRRLQRAEMTFWLDRLYCTFNPLLGCHPLYQDRLPPGQERIFTEFLDIVEQTQLSSLLDSQHSEDLVDRNSETNIRTIRSSWMRRSIWSISAAINQRKNWPLAGIDNICLYLERLTMALVVISRRGDLDGLRIPSKWNITHIYQFAREWKINNTYEPSIIPSMGHLWGLSRRMMEQWRRNKAVMQSHHGAFVILRLCGVMYTLAREAGHWKDIRDAMMTLKPWAGQEITVEDHRAIQDLVETLIDGVTQFVNLSQQRPQNAAKVVVFEKVDFLWLREL